MSRVVRSGVVLAACVAALASAGSDSWSIDAQASGAATLDDTTPVVTRTFEAHGVALPDGTLVTARLIVTPQFAAGANSADLVRVRVRKDGITLRDLSTLGSNPRAMEAQVNLTCSVGDASTCSPTFEVELARESTSIAPVAVEVAYQVTTTALGAGKNPPPGAALTVTEVVPLP